DRDLLAGENGGAGFGDVDGGRLVNGADEDVEALGIGESVGIGGDDGEREDARGVGLPDQGAVGGIDGGGGGRQAAILVGGEGVGDGIAVGVDGLRVVEVNVVQGFLGEAVVDHIVLGVVVEAEASAGEGVVLDFETV